MAIIRSYLSIIASPKQILGQFFGHGWISRWRKNLSAGCFAIPSYWGYINIEHFMKLILYRPNFRRNPWKTTLRLVLKKTITCERGSTLYSIDESKISNLLIYRNLPRYLYNSRAKKTIYICRVLTKFQKRVCHSNEMKNF